MEAHDIVVETTNPGALDRIVQSFGAVVMGEPEFGYERVEDGYVVRVFGDPGFVKFAITNQGYGTVVRELEELL